MGKTIRSAAAPRTTAASRLENNAVRSWPADGESDAASTIAPMKRTDTSAVGAAPASFSRLLSTVLTLMDMPAPVASAIPSAAVQRGCGPAPERPPSATAVARTSEASRPR